VNKVLSLKELAKLIKICKDKGISHLKYGEIELNFDVTANPSKKTSPQARNSAIRAKEIEDKQSLQSQHDDANDIASTLLIENPAEYEAMLTRGELEIAKENH
jgi:hypothetical protein